MSVGRWQGIQSEMLQETLQRMASKHQVKISQLLQDLHRLKESLATERRELARVQRRAVASKITLNGVEDQSPSSPAITSDTTTPRPS